MPKPEKPKLYRITSEGQVYIGGREAVNKLPEPYNSLFIKAMKMASEGKTPEPFSCPPRILTESGFVAEEVFVDELTPTEEVVEEEEGGEDLLTSDPQIRKFEEKASKTLQRKPKSFIDILADKIAEKILERLLK